MNYYNPYYSYPYMATSATTNSGLFSKLFSNGFNWSSILSGTQKTLNVVNQAIPLVKQVSPVMKNAKTMFKLMNEFKKVDTPNPNENNISPVKENSNIEISEQIDTSDYNNGPTFFI